MELYVFVISLAFNRALSQNSQDLSLVVGCSESGAAEVLHQFNGDLVMYDDFQNNQTVIALPPFVLFDINQHSQSPTQAMNDKRLCVSVVYFIGDLLKDTEPPEVQDPPESVLYPADEVQGDEENRLICFVNSFFPPRVSISWTKNNRPVSEGIHTSPYQPNSDQTYRCFSTLTFTPGHGDVYSCSVEHSALDRPKTRIWEVDLKRHQDLALDLYWCFGVTVAFVGVAAGMFLIVKVRYGAIVAADHTTGQ